MVGEVLWCGAGGGGGEEEEEEEEWDVHHGSRDGFIYERLYPMLSFILIFNSAFAGTGFMFI